MDGIANFSLFPASGGRADGEERGFEGNGQDIYTT